MDSVRHRRGLPAALWEKIDVNDTEALAQIPLFRGLPPDQLDMLASTADKVRYQPGDIILKQGALNEFVFFIKDGIAAVTRQMDGSDEVHTLANLSQRDIFGEAGLFSEEKHQANATVSAVTEVNGFAIQHERFIDLLQSYHPAALEVTRILTQRMHFTDERLVREPQDHRLYLVMTPVKGMGGTTIGSNIAAELAKQEGEVVYTEFPSAISLPDEFGIVPTTNTLNHPAGYDIYLPYTMPKFDVAMQLELLVQQLEEKYRTIVLLLSMELLPDIGELLDKTSRAVLIANHSWWEDLAEADAYLENSPYLQDGDIFRVLNNQTPESMELPQPADADFAVPFVIDADIRDLEYPSKSLGRAAAEIAGQLVSQNEVRVFVPTAVDGPILDRTIIFFQDEFPGSKIVREAIDDHSAILSCKTTQELINSKWPHVLTLAKRIKEVLHCETIPVEIKRNLIFV